MRHERRRPQGQRFQKPPVTAQVTTLWDYPSQHYGDEEQGEKNYRGATPSYVIWNVLHRFRLGRPSRGPQNQAMSVSSRRVFGATRMRRIGSTVLVLAAASCGGRIDYDVADAASDAAPWSCPDPIAADPQRGVAQPGVGPYLDGGACTAQDRQTCERWGRSLLPRAKYVFMTCGEGDHTFTYCGTYGCVPPCRRGTLCVGDTAQPYGQANRCVIACGE